MAWPGRVSEGAEDASPAHQASLWSLLDLASHVELGTGLRYVGKIGAPAGGAGKYVALDMRLGWNPQRDLELSLVGQNLLDGRHSEFQPDFILTQPTEVERSIFAKLKWQF